MRKAGVVALVVVALAAGVLVWQRGGLGRTSRPRSVLLISVDTLRADRLGSYRYTAASTPVMDGLAARGLRFTQATTTVPLTLPAHTSLLSGTFPTFHGVRDNGGFYVDGSLTTLAEAMNPLGYRTAGFVAAFVLDRRWGIAQGFDHYFDDFDLSKFEMSAGLDAAQQPVGGSAEEELLVASALSQTPNDWSPDGRFVLYQGPSADEASSGLWILPLDGSRTPRIFLQTRFEEQEARFSPDGRWVAYASDESSRSEIYVRPFADGSSGRAGGGQWQVSTAGGTSPAWAPDGREIYYVAPGGRLMAAPVRAQGGAFEPGTPVALFQTHIVFAQYDVTREGRFLVNTAVDQAAVAPITLIQHWRPGAAK